MKITRIEPRLTVVPIDDTIETMVTLPGWFAETTKPQCDACRFPIVETDTCTAIRCASRTVLLIHAHCLERLSRCRT